MSNTSACRICCGSMGNSCMGLSARLIHSCNACNHTSMLNIIPKDCVFGIMPISRSNARVSVTTRSASFTIGTRSHTNFTRFGCSKMKTCGSSNALGRGTGILCIASGATGAIAYSIIASDGKGIRAFAKLRTVVSTHRGKCSAAPLIIHVMKAVRTTSVSCFSDDTRKLRVGKGGTSDRVGVALRNMKSSTAVHKFNVLLEGYGDIRVEGLTVVLYVSSYLSLSASGDGY